MSYDKKEIGFAQIDEVYAELRWNAWTSLAQVIARQRNQRNGPLAIDIVDNGGENDCLVRCSCRFQIVIAVGWDQN